MDTKMVIFVGSLSNKYIEAFKLEGYSIGFFRDVNDTNIDKFLPNYLHKLSFVISVNFETKESIASSLKNVYCNPDTLLICTFEKHYYPTSLIAENLKLNQSSYLDTQKSAYLTNKYYQRREISKSYPEIIPQYKKIRTFHGAYLFARKFGFPVVVKPANLDKGELVNICENIEELSRKVSYVLDHVGEVYRRDKVYRKPQVIIEEYIPGRQYSVDSYIDKLGNITHTPICKQIISHDLGFDDFQTYCSMYPSELTQIDEEKVLEAVSKSIQALKITTGTTHTEVKLTPDGSAKLIEVNIRPGGFRSEMLEQSYGINHFKNFISSIHGDKIEVNATFKQYSASPQFWASKEGDLTHIEGIEEVKKLKSLKKLKFVAKKNSEVGPVNKGYGRLAYAILAHKNRIIVEKDLIQIRKLLTFTVD